MNEFKNDEVMAGIPHEFSDLSRNEFAHGRDETIIPCMGARDILYGEFPWFVKTKSKLGDLGIEKISDSLKLISDKGFGVYLLPSYPYVFAKADIRGIAVEANFYVNAVLELPKNSLDMNLRSGTRPILVFISRTKTYYEYFAQFDEFDPHGDQIEYVADAIVSQLDGDEPGVPSNAILIDDPDLIDGAGIDSDQGMDNAFEDDLWHGIHVESGNFKGFQNWELNQAISRLSTDYARYSSIQLGDLSTEINLTKREFKHLDNAVYIPLIGPQKCETELQELKIKHQNYCQVVTDPEKILPSYLSNFLNSDLGCKIIELKKSERRLVIPRLNISEIRSIEVAMPSIRIQKQIVETEEKVESVLVSLQDIRENLSLNPMSSKNHLDKLDLVSDAIGELSAADQIKSLIRKGESKTLEFKETFAWDVKKQNKAKWLELEVIKTVAGFLNSDGGNLLIGVSDKGEVMGLEVEISKLHKGNKDKLLNHLKNQLKQKVGAQFYSYYDSNLVDVDDRPVMHISCKRSETEVFVDDKDFYVRTSPATDMLVGREQIEYIKTRFLDTRETS